MDPLEPDATDLGGRSHGQRGVRRFAYDRTEAADLVVAVAVVSPTRRTIFHWTSMLRPRGDAEPRDRSMNAAPRAVTTGGVSLHRWTEASRRLTGRAGTRFSQAPPGPHRRFRTLRPVTNTPDLHGESGAPRRTGTRCPATTPDCVQRRTRSLRAHTAQISMQAGRQSVPYDATRPRSRGGVGGNGVVCGTVWSTGRKCRFRCDLRPTGNRWPKVHPAITDDAKRPRASPKWRLWDGKRGRNAGTGLAAGPTTIVAKGLALLWDAMKTVRIKGI